MTLRVAPAAVATADALPEIVALMQRVFPRERPWGPDLEWQYLRNPSGPARYVNAYGDSGALIAHYALLPLPPLLDSPLSFGGTYLSFNVAADPTAAVPGLMVATTRALYKSLQSDGRVLILGVANENSAQGFVKMLAFRQLGALSLTVHAPNTLPAIDVPRALAADAAQVAWRAARPGVAASVDPSRGAVLARLRHRGVPIDAVLTTGLSPELIRGLALPRASGWVPRLYAGFGGRVGRGLPVPERLRPSPLAYIFRVLGDKDAAEPIHRLLLTRRFEFFDFDVV
jgi:hypothetical protein